MYGRSARSLELDDVFASARAYSTDGYDRLTGSIAGKVTRLVNNMPENVVGAHVAAYRTDRPERIRVGILTDENGEYRIDGLPSGSYLVYAEPVIQGIPDFSYFYSWVVPNFIWPFMYADMFGNQLFGCVGPNETVIFSREHWNLAESYDPSIDFQAHADPITVQQGKLAANVDFEVSSVEAFLGVGVDRQPGLFQKDPSSSRGIRVEPENGSYLDLELAVGFPWQTHADLPVSIYFGYAYDVRFWDAQLLEIDVASGGPPPIHQHLDAAGDFRWILPVSAGMVRRNLFMQAVVWTDETHTTVDRITNPANVWTIN